MIDKIYLTKASVRTVIFMQRAIHTRGKSDEKACPQRSSLLICIAIVFLAASAGPVSADSVPQITGISPSGGPMYGGPLLPSRDPGLPAQQT